MGIWVKRVGLNPDSSGMRIFGIVQVVPVVVPITLVEEGLFIEECPIWEFGWPERDCHDSRDNLFDACGCGG